MRAAVVERFGERPSIKEVPAPTPNPDGVVVRVDATGVCRTDWHAWSGHLPAISLPHVPGHEFAGEVVAVGSDVRRVQVGDRVTVPFVAGCGGCAQCAAGHQQLCRLPAMAGLTSWGSFAELVAVRRADMNVIPLPDDMDAATAAGLGCRFATSFNALVDVGQVTAGEWVAVHGCGGVGLSAVMIASALGANVVGIDVQASALEFASSVGAVAVIDASEVEDVAERVREVTGGGAHVSLDAVGHPIACSNSIRGMRPRGRHVQVGVLTGEQSSTQIPWDLVVSQQLAILGSFGMPAHRYGAMLAMIQAGKLAPERLIGRRVGLAEGVEAMTAMAHGITPGITVITEF